MVLNTTEWGRNETIQAVQLSGRHVLPLLLISIYWIGQGFLTAYHWVYNQSESSRLLFHMGPKRKSALIMVLLLILILAVILPKTLKPQRYERLTEKWAGVWIRNQFGKGMTIFTTVPRVAYYADGDGEYIDLSKNKFDRIKVSMVEKKALYLAIQEEKIIGFPGNAEAMKRDFVEINRFGGKGMERIIVYKRVN